MSGVRAVARYYWIVIALISLAVALLPVRSAADARDAVTGSRSMLYSRHGDPDAVRRVITIEDIRAAGVTRVAEIMALLDNWNLATVDGFTWSGSPGGVRAYAIPEWQVLIDGQVVSLNAFGTRSLNHLPISFSQLDSVEVLTLPALHEGQMAAGILHFHTRQAPQGLSLRGRVMAGSETGDPGPYQLTDESTGNVDRVGPDGAVDASYGTDALSLNAGIAWNRAYVTDRALSDRVDIISGGADPSLHTTSPYFHAALDRFGYHHLFVGYSRFDDLFFFKPYGREIPVVHDLTHLGLDGDISIEATWSLRYRAIYGQAEIGERQNVRDLDFDWKRSDGLAELELHHHGDRYRALVGGGAVRTHVRTMYALATDRFTLGKAYGKLDHRIGERWSYELDGSLLFGDGNTDPNGRLALIGVFGAHVARFQATYLSVMPERDQRVWFWDENGYDFLEDNGVAVTRDAAIERTKTTTVDLTWLLEGAVWRFEVTGSYRNATRMQVERQRFQLDPSELAFAAPVTLVSDTGGEVWGATLVAGARLWSWLQSRGYYRYQAPTSGATDYINLWHTVPRHTASLRVIAQPVARLSLYAGLRYWSSTVWRDYIDADAQSQGRYSSKLDDAVWLDLAVQKWLWGPRMRATLTFENVLDQDVHRHPIGATLGFSVFAQFELFFDSIGR